MTRKLLKKSKRSQGNAGIALLTTIMLLFLMSSLLVGFAVLLASNQQLAGANNDQVVAFYAAEAGMEKLTADLGSLFSITYSPNISQIDALETTPYGPPVSSLFSGTNESITYATADGTPAYTIIPAAVDANGNPAPTITTIKSGPYQGMTAMATEYTLNVNARTSSGREVNLIRTTQTVGIPMFQFGIFGNTDLDFFPGPPFNFGGRTHTNGNLWLATQGTLTLSSKVDAYKDIIRQRLENGYATAGTYASTVDVTTTGSAGNYRSLGMTEGSLVMSVAPYDTPAYTSNWQTISQTDYNSNLINGKGSAFPQYSTGANQLNLAVVTMGGGTTQSIDLIRRPVVGEAANVTNERYFAQASLRILLSDNPTDITSLPCVSAGAPFDLSMLATPPGVNGANWLDPNAPAALQQLAAKMVLYGTPFIPLASSGSAQTTTYSSVAPDGYWMPANSYVWSTPATTSAFWTPAGTAGTYGNTNYFPLIKGYIKIDAQLAPYPTCGCTSSDEKDVTIEVLAWGWVGRNINPVSQSLNGTSLNPQWQPVGTAACASTTSCTQMDLLSNAGSGSTHYYATEPYNQTLPYYPNQMVLNAGYSYPLPVPPTAALGYQNATTLGAGTYTGQAGSCMDPHPNAIIRLERIRDNPSSLYAAHYKNTGGQWVNYVASGTLNTTTNKPQEAPVAVVCGVDPATGTLPIIADSNGKTAMWTPQPWDLWNNTIFDTREGTLRDHTVTNGGTALPSLNGAMHYIELDAHNVARWFGGALPVAGSGPSTADPVVAPDNFVVYISDRRGNNTASTAMGSWPPVSPSGNETGEYGWNDLVNLSTDANGCPDNNLETGEDPDAISQLYTYGANAKYIHAGGWGLSSDVAAQRVLGYGQYGIFAGLAGSGTTFGVTGSTTYCTTTPAYSNTTNSDGIWPMMVPGYVDAVANANVLRENPPLFFRRAVKIVDGSDLTPVGACPGGVNCGLAIAAENPVYIQGDYNANVGGAGWGSTEIASSVAADAVTLLSDYWNDANSFASPYSTAMRNGNTTYYRTAIVAGATVPFAQPTFSGVSADYGTDGGVHNFLRYIEAWGGTLEYNGSIVDLYYSRQATGTFKCCNTVYSPPTRGYNFDTNFLNPTLLPPRTPLFRTVSTTGWTRVLAPQGGTYK